MSSPHYFVRSASVGALFQLWVGGRAMSKDGQSPMAVASHVCLCHHPAGAEQPLSLAFLNSVLQLSTHLISSQ